MPLRSIVRARSGIRLLYKGDVTDLCSHNSMGVPDYACSGTFWSLPHSMGVPALLIARARGNEWSSDGSATDTSVARARVILDFLEI